MPHLHLIIGGIEQSDFDCNPLRKIKTGVWLEEECECLRHKFGRAWYKATGDSFFVGIRQVYSAIGAAAYLSKYLTKSLYGEERRILNERGFIRRVTYSRNWPRGGELKRYGTIASDWKAAGFEPGIGRKWRLLKQNTNYLPEARRVGDNVTVMLARRKARNAIDKYGKTRGEFGSTEHGRGHGGIPDTV